jgi:hypothetical protein
MNALLREDEVYIGTKSLLRKNGWILLAGQPPDGCNHLPVIEVKSPDRAGIGSKGAFKPDLFAYRKGIFLLVECKPAFDPGDAEKLMGIIGDSSRIEMLYAEVMQRNLLERHGIVAINLSAFHKRLRGALAHSGPADPDRNLVVLNIQTLGGDGRIIPPYGVDPYLFEALQSS